MEDDVKRIITGHAIQCVIFLAGFSGNTTAAGYREGVQMPAQVKEVYDLCVIGCGSAGYAAAIRGVDLGKRVCLVERKALGGAGVVCGALASEISTISRAMAMKSANSILSFACECKKGRFNSYRSICGQGRWFFEKN